MHNPKPLLLGVLWLGAFFLIFRKMFTLTEHWPTDPSADQPIGQMLLLSFLLFALCFGVAFFFCRTPSTVTPPQEQS